jgi:hypothetical protein
MVTLTLLDIDRLSFRNARILGIIMAAYGVQLVAVIHNGSMCLRVAEGLIDPFLATIARDVLPVEVTEPFAP